MLQNAVSKIIEGAQLSIDEAISLNKSHSTDELCDAADKVCRHFHPRFVDTCSIINARSGRCSEDCKWCAQSRHYNTGAPEYAAMPGDEIIRRAKAIDARNVRRLSLVTSGRRVALSDIDTFCENFRQIASDTKLNLCASMGLLDRPQLQALYNAGVRRYHCNLETSSDLFPSLCSSHSHADKLHTIALAREIGMEVCVGGIIGMGESMEQRLRLAIQAHQAGAVSIPINILNPIPGTPLQHVSQISEDEILRSVALMRLVAPRPVMRFAGGRARLSDKAVRRMLRGGINGCMIGDLLTTVGNNIDADFDTFRSLGLDY